MDVDVDMDGRRCRHRHVHVHVHLKVQGNVKVQNDCCDYAEERKKETDRERE